MRKKLPARVLALLCACLMFLGLGAAARASAPVRAGTGSTTPAPRTWHVLVGGQGHHHAIQTMGFYPKHLWVDQGDTVEWDANAWEIHTVTFFGKADPCPDGSLCAMPPGGFNPGDPLQAAPHGTSTYDGSSFYSSGIVTRGDGVAKELPPFATLHHHYSLTFPDTLAPGTYYYYCLVHGMGSMGTIVVQAKGSPYPFSQRQYDHRAQRTIHAAVADGMNLWKKTSHRVARMNRKHGTTVFNGAMDETAMVMRFIPRHVTIRRGHRVQFVAQGMGPHTVTMGDPATGCGQAPCNPEQPWNVAPGADGNLTADYPGANGGFTGAPTDLNSGVMIGLPPGAPTAPPGYPPQTLTVRFTKNGKVHYICALHAYMGMVGTVRVKPPRH